MKFTTSQILSIADSNVLSKLASQDLAPLAAYRINRICSILGPEAQRIQQVRNSLITADNSVVLDEDQGIRQIRPECAEDFFKALQPLLAEEIDLNITPISLEDIAGAKISAQSIAVLGPLLASPVEESTPTR